MKKFILFLIILSIPKLCFGAIAATTVWECKQNATAGNVNGGGYNASNVNATVDYSDTETAAHLTITDLVIGADNTTVTSALTPFDSLDPGNILHITAGTNFTTGWYEVVSVTGVTATLDRVCGTALATGGTAYLGGALSLNSTLDNDFFNILIAGNIVYVKSNGSSFSLGEAVDAANDGTSLATITIEGYLTNRGDNPTTTNRPTIACAAKSFILDNYWIVENLILTSTYNFSLRLDDFSRAINVKITNSSASAYSAFYHYATMAFIINCEAISTNGTAIKDDNNMVFVESSYIHDSNIGFATTYGNSQIHNSIIDTCVTGISLPAARYGNKIINNTIYNCTTGILGSTDYGNVITNNIIDTCTTGASWTTEQKSNIFDYNAWGNNTIDVSNVTKGNHDITSAAPNSYLTASAATGDFTLPAGSACLDAGMQVGTNEGATGDYKWNIGADQDDNTTGGGGTGSLSVSTNF